MDIQKKLNQLNEKDLKLILRALIEAGRGQEASQYLRAYRHNQK